MYSHMMLMTSESGIMLRFTYYDLLNNHSIGNQLGSWIDLTPNVYDALTTSREYVICWWYGYPRVSGREGSVIPWIECRWY